MAVVSELIRQEGNAISFGDYSKTEKTKLELDLAGGITRFNFASHPKIAYFDEVSVRFPGGMTPLVFGEAGRRLAFRKK